jgi:hypothetical protein
MFPNALRFYSTFTAIMNISPRCFHAACTITALLLRSFYDFTPILVGYDHVQNKRSESVELPDPRSCCAYKDSTTFLLRFVTIGHVFGQFLIVVEAAFMCERGVIYFSCCHKKWIVHKPLSQIDNKCVYNTKHVFLRFTPIELRSKSCKIFKPMAHNNRIEHASVIYIFPSGSIATE